MAGEEVRITLRGDNAQLGRVLARDLARLILRLESALASAAYVSLGKPRRGQTGRHRAAIESATRLRFRDVRAGSVVAVLELPTLAEETPDTFAFGVDDLAGAAFDRLVTTFNGQDDAVDPTIARALAELAESVGIGDRHTEVIVESARYKVPALRIDAAGRQRMRRLASTLASQAPDVLVGTLREADLDKRTARLRTPSGDAVVVEYPAELEDQIYEAMRRQAQFEGVVTYDPTTNVARRVEVLRISNPADALFADGDFWGVPLRVDDLAAEQGVLPAELDGPMIVLTDSEQSDLASALADLDA